MPTPFQLVLGVAVLVGLGVLFVFGRRLARAFLAYRGTRVVVCPENREMVAVEVDARHAVATAAQGRPDRRLEACTRWPEKAGCGQECLGQIESVPEACLLRNTPRAHLAHLVVHCALHAQGYGHERPAPARRMEAREVAVLAGLGIRDPYG